MRTFIKKSGKAISLIIFVLALFVVTASTATFTVTKTADTNDGFCDADCSLREAVAAANAAAGTDNIVFDATVFNTMQIITLTSGNLVITNSVNSSVTITGPGANLLTVSGNNASKIFTILETPVVTISGMTLTQGNGVGTSPGNNFGGAVYNQGDLTLNNVVVTNSSATNQGGGIYVSTNDSLAINNSTISNNSADSVGGGIYGHDGATINISNSTVSDNTSDSDGGGLFIQTNAAVTNSTVSGNTAAQNGGGAYADDAATFTVTNSTFSGNTAQATIGNGGGGIYVDEADFNMTDSTVRNNISSLNGGGIYFVNVLGILHQGTITGSTISGNTATNNGGGMFVDNMGLQTSNSTISGNSAANGGGIHYIDTGLNEFTLGYSTIAHNNATSAGGGVNVTNQPINGNNTIFGNNTAGTAPDYNGMLASQSYNLIENTTGTTITGNTTGNVTGQDPLLDALANYGGLTETHRLMPGSPAIDAANPMNFPLTDQRGVMRPIDGNNSGGAQPDIGSFEATAPTAASVTVSGRVTNGLRGIPRATVVLTDAEGNSRTARTNHFGYFRFEDVSAGQTYVVSVYSKQYQFYPQVIFVGEDFSDLNFIGVRLTKPRRL